MKRLVLTLVILLGFTSAGRALADAALDKAFFMANVTKSQLTQLEQSLDEESGIRVHKIEFATKCGDYDFHLKTSNLKLIDADFEVDDKCYLHQKTRNLSVSELKQLVSKRFSIDENAIKLRREGRFVEGRAFFDGLKYEFEADLKSGVIFNFNADLRE